MKIQFDRDFKDKIEAFSVFLKSTNRENMSEENREFLNRFINFLESEKQEMRCHKRDDHKHWMKMGHGFWHGHHGKFGHHGKHGHHGHHGKFGYSFGKDCHDFGKHGKHGRKGGKHFWALWEKSLLQSNSNEDIQRIIENVRNASLTDKGAIPTTSRQEGSTNAFDVCCFRKGHWKSHGYRRKFLGYLVDGETQTEQNTGINANVGVTQENMDTTEKEATPQSPMAAAE